MITRSPCDLYIKYLVAHPTKYSDDQIRTICILNGLHYIGHPNTQGIRAGLRVPVPFYPYDEHHEPSMRFLIKHKLRPIFFPDADMRMAKELRSESQSREITESFIISEMDHAWIASALRRDGFEASTEAVRYYAMYYYNLRGISRSELIAMIKSQPDVLEGTVDQDEQALAAAMEKSKHVDSRLTSAYMEIKSFAGLANMMRRGYMPGGVELSRIASIARITSTMSVANTALRGGYGDSERARNWAIAAKTMNEMMTDIGSPDEEFKNELMTITLKTDDTEVPLISELSHGNHTVELQPINAEENK